MSGHRPLIAYESVHNQSLGKMEMLEAIDGHIKNVISRDIAFLKSEISKLKKMKSRGGGSLTGSSRSNRQKPSRETIENGEEIRRIGRDLGQLSARVNMLSTSLESIKMTLSKVQNQLSNDNEK